jgi:hypothetical protein
MILAPMPALAQRPVEGDVISALEGRPVDIDAVYVRVSAG